MREVGIIGVELAKNMFQLHLAAADGSVAVMLCISLAGGDQD